MIHAFISYKFQFVHPLVFYYFPSFWQLLILPSSIFHQRIKFFLHCVYPMLLLWRRHCFFKRFRLIRNINEDYCINIIVLINKVDPLSIPWRWFSLSKTKFNWCAYYHKFGTSTNYVTTSVVSGSKSNTPIFHLTHFLDHLA